MYSAGQELIYFLNNSGMVSKNQNDNLTRTKRLFTFATQN